MKLSGNAPFSKADKGIKEKEQIISKLRQQMMSGVVRTRPLPSPSPDHDGSGTLRTARSRFSFSWGSFSRDLLFWALLSRSLLLWGFPFPTFFKRSLATGLLAAVTFSLPPGSRAETMPPPPPQVSVRGVEQDLTLVTQTGHRLVLEALAPPFRPFFLPESQPWPWLNQAQAILQQHASDQPFWLHPTTVHGKSQQDRYGRWRVWLSDSSSSSTNLDEIAATSLQARLIAKGLGRVLPLPGAKDQVTFLLDIEAKAREQGKGAWGSWTYAILTPEAAHKAIGAYNLVQGQVKSVTRRSQATYLNFGQDWRQDFTVKVLPQADERLAASGIDLATISGQEIRARGWIFFQNGPMIEVRQMEQIELLPR